MSWCDSTSSACPSSALHQEHEPLIKQYTYKETIVSVGSPVGYYSRSLALGNFDLDGRRDIISLSFRDAAERTYAARHCFCVTSTTTPRSPNFEGGALHHTEKRETALTVTTICFSCTIYLGSVYSPLEVIEG